MRSDFKEFCDNFDMIDNALKMRTLIRWNGRDVRNRENLAEHTHLVIACIFKVLDVLHEYLTPASIDNDYDMVLIIKSAMLHDSLELLRGDILSITKDAIEGLRDAVDKEEKYFMQSVVGELNKTEQDIIELADLMACYKFLEREISFPNNDFAKQAYIVTMDRYNCALSKFLSNRGVNINKDTPCEKSTYSKGYNEDAGVDILLNKSCTFLPMSTTYFSLDCNVDVAEGEMAILCSRSSAAVKGLCVATCPIDPGYTGMITAIVHNISNDIISFNKGEAFCQIVKLKTVGNIDAPIRKAGKRRDGKLGSTGA